MRVLTSLNYYHPHWTGLTMYARHIAEGLVARGHEVTVLTSQHDRALPREEEIGGVHVRRLPVAVRVSRAMLTPGSPLELAREVGRHDLVHIHSPSTEALLCAAIARASRRPVAITHQGDVVLPAGRMNRAVQGAMHMNLAGARRLATAVVTHSEDYARHSRFLAPVAATVQAITPPTQLPPPDPIAAAQWRDSLGFGAAPVVGFAGRFVEEKGFDVLLRAIPLVRSRVPEVRFAFAGETDVVYEHFFDRWRHVFEEHSDALTSVGLLRDRQRLADFYAMCDLFVLPSRTDCFGAVQVEALLSGTPLLTADIPGAREVVLRSGMGRLFPAGDPVALAEAIIESIEVPPTRPDREAVAACFDAENALDRYEALFEQLVAGARPPATQTPAAAPQLTPEQLDTLDTVLRNEADTAYRRRVPTLMSYLDLHDDDMVLDCGCGMGYLSMVMGELSGATLVGVDGDADRLGWAAREGVRASLARVDITTLPFVDGAFTKVLMSEVLEHLPHDVQALREVWRVLAPGGVVAVSVPHANYPFLWDPINRTREAFGAQPMRSAGPITGQWSNHQRLYLPADLREVGEAAGFEVTHLEEQTHHVAPLQHVLVYSIGKPLIERELLPSSLRSAADRFSSRRNTGSLRNPVNLAVAGLRAVDRRNDRPQAAPFRSHVSLVARLVKPGGAR